MTEIQFIDIDKQEDSDGSSGSVANFTEPVTLAEVKAHLIITSDDDDVYLDALLSACRATIENFCHISLVEKIITVTLRLQNQNFSPWEIRSRYYTPSGKEYRQQPSTELPEGPLVELISAASIFNGQSTVLVENIDYFLSGSSFKTITFVSGFGDIILVYKTGYPIIPYNLKLAILNEITYRYESRGDKTNRYASQNVGLCESAEYLARPFKRTAWE